MRINISIVFFVFAFWLSFIVAYASIAFLPYLSGFCLLVALFYSRKITLDFFLVIMSISFLLLFISPSATIIASLFPLIGFLFAGDNKLTQKITYFWRHALIGSLFFFYAAFFFLPPEVATASHNYLSVLTLYAIIAEFLLFGKPSRGYIILILISFFILGNRSSIFLILTFVKSKISIFMFFAVAVLFIGITLGNIEAMKSLQFFFVEGGLLNRSYGETRGDYIDEFIKNFNFWSLSYQNWNFSNVPQTTGGFYDLHNSFLTLIVRDSYLGIFKICLWLSQIFLLPLGLFSGITLRAYYDTFLLGGVNDILTYALIGSNIRLGVKNIFQMRSGVFTNIVKIKSEA
jgi:hypothetical protein